MPVHRFDGSIFEILGVKCAGTPLFTDRVRRIPGDVVHYGADTEFDVGLGESPQNLVCHQLSAGVAYIVWEVHTNPSEQLEERSVVRSERATTRMRPLGRSHSALDSSTGSWL